MFHLSILIILVIVAILGTIGNILIIGAVFFHRRLRMKGNGFIINLAVADLIITAVIMPLGLAQSQHEERIFTDLLCDFNAFLILTSCGVSTQSLMMIAIERYIHVCRMEMYHKVYTPCLLAFYIIFTWIYTMAWTIHGWTGWTKFVYGSTIYICVFSGRVNLSYSICLAFFGMLLPMVVLAVCYICIFRTVRASKASLEAYKTSNSKRDSGSIELVVQSDRRVQKEQRLLITLFTIVVLFVLFWIPAAIVLLFSGVWKTMPREVNVISVWLALCNSCVNSIVYGVLNRNFQNGYKEILQSLVCCRPRQDRCSCTSLESSEVKSDSGVKTASAAASSSPKSTSSTPPEVKDGGVAKNVTESNNNNNNGLGKRGSWSITYMEESFAETKM